MQTKKELVAMDQEHMKKLNEYREKIKNERRFVDVKPYSHNIISLLLMAIAKEFGRREANKAIVDLKLQKLGWTVVDETQE